MSCKLQILKDYINNIIDVISHNQIDQDMTIYWHGCMQYIVVVTVDLMKTSQVIQTGPTPSDVLHNQAMGRVLLRKCCDVLMQKFQSQQLPWNVYPCTWPQQQEEMIKIR